MRVYPLGNPENSETQQEIAISQEPIHSAQCFLVEDIDMIKQQKECPEIGKIYSFIETEKLPENHKF